MQRTAVLSLVAVVVSILSMQLATTNASARVHSFQPVSEHGAVLTFKVRGLDGRRIRSARVSGPRRTALRVNVGRVRRAAQRGLLRVRTPRGWLRTSSRTRRAPAAGTHHGRGRHKLSIVVDTTPPETTITSGPAGTISSSAASFSFGSSESPSTFECRLDASSWAACSSPKSYSGLTDGSHTFDVRAKDAAGNVDSTPSARSFTVQTDTPQTDTPQITPTTGDGKATTRPVGSSILSDADAASRVRRSSFEPRPKNAQANKRVPTADELRHFVAYSPNWGPCAERLKLRITGSFTGTTDEIIQWAAHKWGIDEDIVRAVAVKESYWNQDTAGDVHEGVAYSYGLTQIRRNAGGESAPNWNGTFPLSRDSTAFNLDYWGASVRQYFEGCSTWLLSVGGNVGTYSAGDIWGSVGAWFAGRWWNDGAQSYVNDVRANLQRRTWEQPGF